MRILLLFTVYCLLFSNSFGADVSLNAISNAVIEKLVMKNGLNLLFMKKDDLEMVNLDISFKNSGYSYDPSSKHGIAYFVSQLLKEGSTQKDVNKFNKELKRIGARVSTSVDRENLIISLMVLSENFEQATNLLREMIFSVNIDDAVIKRIKARQSMMLKKNLEHPDFVAKQLLIKAMYGNHPYANPMLGTLEEIESFTADDIIKYTQSSFNTVNAVISVVGNVAANPLVKILDKMLYGLTNVVNEMKRVSTFVDTGFKKKRDDLFFEMNAQQNVIYFGRDGVNISDDDYYNAVILNYILGGGGLNSLLMSGVRGNRGLTYGIKTDMINDKHSDMFIGTVATANDTATEVMSTIKEVLKDASSGGIGLKHFDAAKYNIVNSFVLNLETNNQLVSLLNYIQINNLSINYVDTYLRGIDNTSINGLNRFAAKFIDLDKFYFVEVGKKHNS